MANIRYDATCPSCEASVPIRSTAAIGKKIECPKCKYRFIAPEPPDEDDEGDGAVKTKKKAGTKKGEKKKSSPMVLIGVLLGVVAVGALCVGGYLLFGGDKAATTSSSTGDPSKKGGGGTGTEGGAIEEGETQPGDGTVTPTPPVGPKKAEAAKGKDITNLLPGETTAVYRVNMDRLALSATPLKNAAIDSYTKDLFQSSFTIEADNVETYIHCVTGPDREPFAVIRTKSPMNEREMYQKLQLEQPKNPVIRGRSFYLLKANPFVDAVSRALTTQALVGLLGLPLNFPPPADSNKAYAMCVYDTQTLMISTELTMEKFLTDLQDNGFPQYKTELIPLSSAAPPPADPNAPPGGPAAGPGGPPTGRVPGGRGPGERADFRSDERNYDPQPPKAGAAGLTPIGPGGPEGPGGPPAAPGGEGVSPSGRRPFTSLPSYRTIDPALKKMLNQIEEDEQNPPAVVYAEMIDQRIFNARQLGAAAEASGDIVLGLLAQIKIVGLSLIHLKKEKGDVRLFLEYLNADDAKTSVSKHLLPILTLGQLFGQPMFGTTIKLVNNAGQSGGPDGGGPPGAPNIPGSGPPGGRGGEGGFQPPPGGEGQNPGGFGSDPVTGQTKESSFTVDLADNVVTITSLINWSDEKYNSEVLSRVNRFGNQVKGRMAVLSGESDYWQYLAVAMPKVQKKSFPRGTIERDIEDKRYRLAYPPEQRTSFMADLLPYIGRGNVRVRLQDKKLPWYAKENLPAAETWVPEFLVPYYPQDSWRAHHPLAGDASLGGTNYAGLAGLGLDSARYDPNNPEMAKKVGMVGYDWASKPEDVRDGMSNTIFMVQTAPGIGRAWVAGGGSTVLGVADDNDPMKPFVHKTPSGARGTYVLMADGSVRWLKEGTDPKLFKALVTRAGGETMSDLEKDAPKLKPVKPIETDLKTPGASGTPTAPKADAVDADELKKFQGKWRASLAQVDGKLAPAIALAQKKIAMEFEGDRASFTAVGSPTLIEQIIRLDPKTDPKQLDTRDPKGVISLLIYEFATPTRLKIRGAKPGTPRPSKVALPEEGSKDLYLELEKIGN